MYANKADKPKTGWLSYFGVGAHGSNKQDKTEKPGKTAAGKEVNEAARLVEYQRFEDDDDLPDPVPLSQMRVKAGYNSAGYQSLETDEGIGEDPEADGIPPYVPNNLAFEGPVPDLRPKVPVLTSFERGQKIAAELERSIGQIDVRWPQVVACVRDHHFAPGAIITGAAYKEYERQLSIRIDSLLATMHLAKTLILENQVALVTYDTPHKSGKDVVSRIDSWADLVLDKVVPSAFYGTIAVNLPPGELIRVTNSCHELKEATFKVLASALAQKTAPYQAQETAHSQRY